MGLGRTSLTPFLASDVPLLRLAPFGFRLSPSPFAARLPPFYHVPSCHSAGLGRWCVFLAPSSVDALRVPNNTWPLPLPFPGVSAKAGVCGEPPYINQHTHVRSRKVRRARSGPRRLIRLRECAGGGSPGVPRPGSRQYPSSVRFIRRDARFRSSPRQATDLSDSSRQHASRWLQAHLARGHHAGNRIQKPVHWRNLRERASSQRAGSAGRSHPSHARASGVRSACTGEFSGSGILGVTRCRRSVRYRRKSWAYTAGERIVG
jgi:hypothetical protein